MCVGPIAGVATEVWLAYNRRLSGGVARITERGSSIEKARVPGAAGIVANWTLFTYLVCVDYAIAPNGGYAPSLITD